MSGEPVAIKQLRSLGPTPYAVKPYAVKILENEARREVQTLDRLSGCRNVIGLRAWLSDAASSTHLIVMEAADGGEVYSWLNSHAAGISEEQARSAFRQMVAGVGQMHGRGVAHRDLKLENAGIELWAGLSKVG